VVVSGGFVEAGDRGRHRLAAGNVAFHAELEAHRDQFERAGAVVLDLPLDHCPALATGELDAVDEVVRLATRDLHSAAALLTARVQPAALQLEDWPDALARALATEPDLSLTDWADRTGLSPQTVSRGFRQAYGTSPKRFRAEHRAQRAVRALAEWTGTLASLAAEAGFVDQAHLTRTVRALTGSTPGQLRAKWVQDGSHASG
jgi:AraC-like DNA-binding protein